MPRPTRTFPSPGQIHSGTRKPLPEPQFDGASFDEFIRSKGLRWRHLQSSFCPNISDLESHVHDPNCRICDNGYIFYGQDEIFGIMEQNKLERFWEIQGLWDAGAAVATFISYLDGPNGEQSQGKMVDFMVGDKLVCLDYTFRWTELVENSPTGIDRLRYPAITVEFLRDAWTIYCRGVDFEITPDGMISWLSTGKRPAYQTARSRGGIYTIVYTAHPVFFVEQIIHEIRATKGEDRVTGNVQAIRLPQQLLIRRDFMFKHPGDKIGSQDSDAPRSGSLVTPD
jgi:hypothetical protein